MWAGGGICSLFRRSVCLGTVLCAGVQHHPAHHHPDGPGGGRRAGVGPGGPRGYLHRGPASIQKEGLFGGFNQFLEQGVSDREIRTNAHLTPLDALAGYLATGVARAALFAIVFFGGLLVWFLFSHALDLAFKLPILAEVNLAGGLLAGLVKGGLLAVVLVWLGQLAGVVPSQPDTPVLSLFTVEKLGELLDNLPA